jgi:hypothetical protein
VRIAASHRAARIIRRGRGAFGLLAAAAVLAATAQAQPLPAATPAQRATGATVELGRLFFTPEERREFDRRRDTKTPEKPPAATDPTLTIDGVVTRSSGKRTVWINGAAHNDGAQPDGIAIGTSRQTPGRIVVRPSGAPPIPAKVGETVDRATGEAGAALGGGSIATHSPAPR